MRNWIVINFVAKYSNIIIQFLLTTILARLLTPSDYGVVAIVSIFVSFFGVLGDMGIGPAIVQYKKMENREVNYIFKFTLLIALVLSILFYFFSFVVGIFYNNTVYQSVCQFMTIGIFFMICSIVPMNLLYREKNFLSVGISIISSNIIGGVVAIYTAYLGWGVFSLIINMIIQSLSNFILCVLLSRMKIYYHGFSWQPIKKIASFSVYQFLFNFVNFFTRNFDNLLVGKLLGAKDLGYYDRAYRTMVYPLQGLTFVISPVLQPVLSDYVNDHDKIYTEYLKVINMLGLLSALIVPMCFFNAKEIIYILFGNQWSGSVVPFQWLSLSIGIQLVLSPIGTIFQATYNTRYMFITGLISSITFTSITLVGLILGRSIVWLSIFLSIGFLVNFIQNYYVLVTKIFNKSFISFAYKFKVSILITIILFVEGFLLPWDFTNIYTSAIIKGIVITISYFLLCVLFRQWKTLYSLIK